jgi:hypothetical protein
MPVLRLNGDLKLVRFSAPLTAFPELHARLLAKGAAHPGYPTTPEMEALGRRYVNSGFLENETDAFVHDVCFWGNYPGVWGNVVKHNALTDIRTRLQRGYQALQADNAE